MKYKLYKLNTISGKQRAYSEGLKDVIDCLSNLGMNIDNIRITLDNNGNYSKVKIT